MSHLFRISFLLHFAYRQYMNQVVSILGCGWLGKALGRVLASSGYRVIGSTTKRENMGYLQAAGITPFVFEVSELLPENFDRQFFNTDVLVISLPHGVRRGKSQEYVDQINWVTQAANHAHTKHIILMSTTSVYPNLDRIVTEEDADPQNPIVKAEAIVLESGIPGTVLRFAGLYGPGRDPGRFLAGRRDVKGANAPVNMIHMDDCVGIIKNVIENNQWNKVLNACADEHPTKKVFYSNAALALGLDPPLFSDEPKTEYKIVSNERLKDTLNYRFYHQPI